MRKPVRPKAVLAVAAPVLITGVVAGAVLLTAPGSKPAASQTLTAHDAGASATNFGALSPVSQHGRTASSAAHAGQAASTGRAGSSASAGGNTAGAGTGTLRAGSLLKPGHGLYSANHAYGVLMQTDGNLVVYRVSGKRWMWSSQTAGHPGAEALFQKDGNLVVYTPAKKALWASGTKATAKAVLVMGNTGDLVIKASASGATLWSSKVNLSVLLPGQVLAPGRVLYSPSHAYTVQMQTDGNLVVRHGKAWLWSSETGHHPGAFAVYQTDGNLVVYSPSKNPLWASATQAGPSSFAGLQNDGNFVIYAAKSGPALWSSRQALSDLLPGWLLPSGHILYSPNHDYMLVMQTDGNLVVYNSAKKALWATNTKSPGAFATYQKDGNFVVYSAAKKALWASGTKAGASSFLTTQNDGNVVIYSAPGGSAIWASGS